MIWRSISIVFNIAVISTALYPVMWLALNLVIVFTVSIVTYLFLGEGMMQAVIALLSTPAGSISTYAVYLIILWHKRDSIVWLDSLSFMRFHSWVVSGREDVICVNNPKFLLLKEVHHKANMLAIMALVAGQVITLCSVLRPVVTSIPGYWFIPLAAIGSMAVLTTLNVLYVIASKKDWDDADSLQRK